MRTALCGVILIATGASGLCIAGAYRRRERLLATLVSELQRLEEQVRLGRPLAQALSQSGWQIFRQLSGSVEAPGLSQAWRLACQQAGGGELLTAIEVRERQAMDAFFDELGTLDSRSQQRRFDETRRQLAVLHAQAAEEALRRSRLYGSLGILLGLSVVVLLW